MSTQFGNFVNYHRINERLGNLVKIEYKDVI